MISKPVLQLIAIRKSYGQTEALRGMSFCVGTSELVALLGPNGAGKSTLFQIAAGLFRPDSGEVKLFGSCYRKSSSAILSKLGVVFQSRSLDVEMTGQANLSFHGALFGLAGRNLRARIGELANLLEITDLLDQPVRTLSGGNQRRLEIARALLNRPKLLLMDEPTVGLDIPTRRLFVRHIETIRRVEGTSILWATHLVDEVEDADRVVLIRNGSVLHNGPPAELKLIAGTDSLTQAYVALAGPSGSEADL
ncbi:MULTISPECIES: ATP-binding cassette domain-containing protein [unclassified Devosia]|uniref:ATP-binding cassette domain-containing protein n=1 Tax=unclassified Devosia TaxID=196773 RepID=UPI00155172CC|nr:MULTISPECIES: ATP-binding cassette domain-containing protein [unclassified Devosia]